MTKSKLAAKKSPRKPATKAATVPVSKLAIGAPLKGGIYAGLTIHDNKPHALVLLPGDASNVKWDEAGKWAAKQGGELPSRIDCLVLLKNVKKEFKESWYWSGEQFESDSGYAWFQSFGYGVQSGNRKGSGYRARAVRRLPI